jgi:hypothetical protein
MTTLPPTLSPNNILLPPPHCSLISETKVLARFLFVFHSSPKFHKFSCACNFDELEAYRGSGGLVPSFLPREPGFDPGSIRVWFMVGRLAGDQLLLAVMRLSPSNIAPQILRSNICLCALPTIAQSVSDSLRTGQSGDRIPAGAIFSAPIQTSPGTHTASYTIICVIPLSNNSKISVTGVVVIQFYF